MKNKNKLLAAAIGLVIILVVGFVTVSQILPAARSNPPTATFKPPTTTIEPPTATIELPTATPILQSSAAIQVNPVNGMNPNFIMGADISMLAQIEAGGGKYFVNGIEEDCLKILKDHGVNWVRLRIWNDPTDPSGAGLGGGNNDLETTVSLAKRAKAMGLKFLLDFHYSDWWADPGQQNKPKAWVGLTSDQLQQALYDYTAKVIQTLAKAGAMPDMVEIGNEVNDGMLWPDGKITRLGAEQVGGYDGFANLLKQGIQAVRDNDPNSKDPEKKVKTIIHLANGGDNSLYRTIFDALTERNVDFDIIGLSYYSYWHGTLDQLQSNMNDISERYHKDVVVAETAYAFTLKDADGHANLFGDGAQIPGGYKATTQGQATAVRDVIAAVAQVPNGKGLGIFYWEPDWIPVQGAGWKAGEGSAWENQAMFDFNGNALPSINVFNLVKASNASALTPAAITGVYTTNIKTHLQEEPQLPNAVKADFSDDSIRNVPVTWDPVIPSKLDYNGTFSLKGTVAGSDMKAVAYVLVDGEKSLLENAGFENGDLTSWTVEGSTTAVNVSPEAQNIHDGKFALHYWLNDPFTFTISQKATGLKNGTYTLSVWIQGGGGEDSIQLFASGYGGEPLIVDIQNTGWQKWQNPIIANIRVTSGECIVGLKVVAKAGNWGFIDDMSLTQNK